MSEKYTLLYIDDEPTNLLVFQATFSRYYNVITVESGFEGLLILQSNPNIKIVITDFRMPEMDGVEFITKAKNITSDKLYYILTGYDITVELTNAIEYGMIKKCFFKPFRMKEIIETINKDIENI
jgi:response regulator RpfG family c-di-GMP phosphodiesterase